MTYLEKLLFKKIHLWILFLTILLSLLLTVGFGVLVRQELVGYTKFGMVSKSALFLAEIPSNIKKTVINFTGDALKTEDQRFDGQVGFHGTPLDKEAYLLLSRYDKDRSRSVVELVDLMTFEIIHEWVPDIETFNSLVDVSRPEFKHLLRDNNYKRARLLHPLLTSDGGLIFTHGQPLRKIDFCSNIVWQNQTDVFHHSIEYGPDGNIWAPTHLYPFSLDKKYIGDTYEDFLDDAITKLSSTGKVLFQKSVTEILIENGQKQHIFGLMDSRFTSDPIHLNDIQPVFQSGEYWNRGDLFLSARHQSKIYLYRPAANKIVWQKSFSSHQHDVDILDDHRIVIFDNNSFNVYEDKEIVDGHNQILIYDFKTDNVIKYLPESLIEHDVRTISEGLLEITSDGQLFIEEQNFGRILFFEKNGELRWYFVNRANNGLIYILNWSRLLHTDNQVNMVKEVLANNECK